MARQAESASKSQKPSENKWRSNSNGRGEDNSHRTISTIHPNVEETGFNEKTKLIFAHPPKRDFTTDLSSDQTMQKRNDVPRYIQQVPSEHSPPPTWQDHQHTTKPPDFLPTAPNSKNNLPIPEGNSKVTTSVSRDENGILSRSLLNQ